MTDDEIMVLMKFNIERTENEKDRIMEEFYKMDEFIVDKFKENSTHKVFKSKKLLNEAMQKDFNPYNTFEVRK